MRKRPFLVFILVIGILVAGVVGFIQSAQFATLLKRAAVRYLPTDLGVDGDFSELSIRLFPPGLSVKSPQLMVRKKNFLNLPAGSVIRAARMDLTFLPFQMLSGNIRVNQVRVVDGDVQLKFDPSPAAHSARKSGLGIHWDELLQIRADSFALEHTRVHLSWVKQDADVEFLAEDASVGQWSSGGNQGYEVLIALKEAHGRFPKEVKVPLHELDALEARAVVSAKGVRIDSLSLASGGVKVKAEGQIDGDVLNPKGLSFEGEMSVAGALASVLKLASAPPKVPVAAQGGLVFRGKVKASFDHLAETLHADGSLAASGLKYGAWEADKVEAQGSWTPTSEGGEFSVTKAVVTSPERKREGGFQSGSGGKLEVGAFKIRMASREPVTIPIKLERAHLHWIGAAALRNLYPLDLRVTGPAQLTYQPARDDEGWRVSGQLDWKITDFKLDNQRLHQVRPLKRILEIQEIGLRGGIVLDAQSFRPDALTLSAGKSMFAASGKIDFKSGWDMRFAGNAFLQDVGKIADNEIRGQGPLDVHVHGTTEKVLADFDADLKDAYYLRMSLGDLKGRITWDDDPSHLILTGLELRQGRTSYFGDGLLDLGDADTVAIKLRFEKGRMEDLNQIFQSFTREFWWFPKSLTGEMSGDIQVSGGISLDALKVRAKIGGPGWELLGERLGRADVVGGYDRGKFYLESFEGAKPAGKVRARISYDKDGTLDWQASTEGFLIGDFDHVARLDVPIRGRLEFASQGSGKLGTIVSQTRASLADLTVRGSPFAPSSMSIASAGSNVEVHGSAFGGQGSLDAMMDLKEGGQSKVRGELRELDFSPILLLLNPKSLQDQNVAGRISGRVDLGFPSNHPEIITGQLNLSQYLLAKSGTSFNLAKPVSLKIDRGSFNPQSLVLKGPRGNAQLAVSARSSKLEGTIDGQLDASIAEFFTSAIQRAQGLVNLDFRLGGTLMAPTLEGGAELDGATIRLASLDSPFENVTGRIGLKQNVISVERLGADLANGRVTGGGTIELFVDRYPKISLTGNVNGSRLRIFPFQFVKLRGKLNVRGGDLPYLVDGGFLIESGMSREKVMSAGQGRGLKSARYTPPPTASHRSDYPLFKLDIDVKADQGLMVQNDLFDAELKAQIKVVNTIETPRLLGSASVVQGHMTFKDRVFAIQSGEVRFDNPTVLNPAFNLAASTEVGNSKIQLYASGRVDDPKIDLSSNPAMPESEILSLLALGASTEEVRKFRGSDRSVYEQGEAASLVLHSLDFNREVQNRTGFQIQLNESVNNQTGSSVFLPRSDTDTTVAPKIVIKRRIGKKATVSVGSTVGVGANSQREVNLEYQVTPGFSVNGIWDANEGATQASKEQQSYGVDLKLQKRFK